MGISYQAPLTPSEIATSIIPAVLDTVAYRNLVNDYMAVVPSCYAVCIKSNGKFIPAQTDTVQHATVLGLTIEEVAANAVGTIQTFGLFPTTEANWDRVTGQSGGLTPGLVYYLNVHDPGKISLVPPTSKFLVVVGKATDPRTLLIDLVLPVVF